MFFLKRASDPPAEQRLTGFEEYMLADDRPDYPMSFFLQVALRGRLDRQALERAVSLVVPRHACLTARAVPVGRGAHAWQPSHEPVLVADLCPCVEAIDLATQSGLRVQLGVDDNGRHLLRFQFHHACCDGRGGMELIAQVLVEYRRLLRGDVPRESNGQAATLGPRELMLSWPATFARNHKDGLRIWRFYATTPVAVEGAAEGGDGFRYPAFVSHTASVGETRALLRAAKARGVTLNDLLMRDLYLAVRGWLAERGALPRRGAVRLSIPIDMHLSGAGPRRCENDVSFVLVDRRFAQMDSPNELLRSIAGEMHQVKRDRMGVTLWRATRWLRLMPGGMRATLNTDRCLTSTVLSNLGALPWPSELLDANGSVVAGDLTIESVSLLPPFRCRTPLAFGVLTYAGALHIALHYDQRRIDTASAEAMLRKYVSQLAESAS